MKLLCECNSFNCDKTIDIVLEEAKEIKDGTDNIIIVHGCPKGPDLLDVFVRRESGYSIYKETKK